jgi:N-acetylmuramic acid 6-phosphate etherase
MTLARLTTESRNPASEEIDRLSSLEIVRLMNAEDARVAEAVGRIAESVAAAIDVIADRLRAGGRLIYIGAGTSGRLGVLDASECPPTFNSPPWQVVGMIAGGHTALTRAVERAEDHPQQAAVDLKRIDLSGGDVLVGIATSGRTPYVIGGLNYAREVGAFTIGLSCNDDSELSAVAQLMLTPVVGPEVISGSTRLKAGTATKLLLNMLTTGAMVRLGKTYGNLMVDLQATNQKLADRSRRIVSALTGVTTDEAAALLERSNGDVKTAVVVQQRGVSAEDARALLHAAGGQLRGALTFEDRGSRIEDRTSSIAPSSIHHSPSSIALVLGVDGGGSKTLAWLAPLVAEAASFGNSEGDSSRQPGRSLHAIGEAGPSNPQSAGWAAALANVDRAIHNAFVAAGIPRATVASACLAIAGAGREAEQERLRTWAQQRRIAEHVVVTHDAQPVLAAGTPHGTGIAVIAGTGSFVFGSVGVQASACGPQPEGCTPTACTARAGGWGFLIGDDGSGYDIARQGLRAAMTAVDGRGPATNLERAFAEALGVSSARDLPAAVARHADDREWIAGLARIVFTAAEAGDAVAAGILDRAADDLAALIESVARQLCAGTHPVPLALAGGLLVHSALLQDRLVECVGRRGVIVETIGLVPDPVAGAVMIARNAALARDVT